VATTKTTAGRRIRWLMMGFGGRCAIPTLLIASITLLALLLTIPATTNACPYGGGFSSGRDGQQHHGHGHHNNHGAPPFAEHLNASARADFESIVDNPNRTRADIRAALDTWAIKYNVSAQFTNFTGEMDRFESDFYNRTVTRLNGTALDLFRRVWTLSHDDTLTFTQFCQQIFPLIESNLRNETATNNSTSSNNNTDDSEAEEEVPLPFAMLVACQRLNSNRTTSYGGHRNQNHDQNNGGSRRGSGGGRWQPKQSGGGRGRNGRNGGGGGGIEDNDR